MKNRLINKIKEKSRKKKRGVYLIELIIGISIIIIIMGCLNNLFLSINNQYFDTIHHNINRFYANEALEFIEKQIYIESKNVAVSDNKLILDKKNYKRDIIKQYENKLIIKYGYTYSMGSNYNIITENINEFNIVSDENVIFIELIMEDGEKVKRCLSLKK